MAIRIVDVTDDASFALLPPCADPGFDHRSCDYWEDARPRIQGGPPVLGQGRARVRDRPPPRSPRTRSRVTTPSRPSTRSPRRRADRPFNPFADDDDAPVENPFAPQPRQRPAAAGSARPKLRLLGRGLTVFGSYAKVLLRDDEPAAYAQFGPLSAYPRAIRTRELYPRLPDAPLPAVITCISTTPEARRQGLAAMLVEAVCDDLAGRGFAAVETYPEVGAREDATSAAQPAFWERLGFVVAAPDERYPVMRRELA